MGQLRLLPRREILCLEEHLVVDGVEGLGWLDLRQRAGYAQRLLVQRDLDVHLHVALVLVFSVETETLRLHLRGQEGPGSGEESAVELSTGRTVYLLGVFLDLVPARPQSSERLDSHWRNLHT